jgi:D-3-phosphoglycerate dehydrogenase
MKKGVLIVNTARGPLIDEAALVAALDSGQVGGAALDVLAAEPPPKTFPLQGRDNVILTPHTASDVARVLSGEKPVYPISA